MTKPVAPTVSDVGELPTNWGRWGDDDERGTLNHIDDAARLRAAASVTSGRTVSLAMPLTPLTAAGGGPTPRGLYPMPAPVQQVMVHNGSPTLALTDVLTINTHHIAMTHIDALSHVPIDGMVYPGVPINDAVAAGTVRHGSTTAFADGIVTRGVLLDLAPGGRLDPEHPVTGHDLDQAVRRAGLTVEPGDALVVRGGWTVHLDFAKGLPGMTVDAVRWMHEHRISLCASDIGDRPPTIGLPMPLHEVALARMGLPLVDGADLDELAQECARQNRSFFLFALGAMPVHGATGVPVNPLAIF